MYVISRLLSSFKHPFMLMAVSLCFCSPIVHAVHVRELRTWPSGQLHVLKPSSACGKRIEGSVKSEDMLSLGLRFVSRGFCASILVTGAFPWIADGGAFMPMTHVFLTSGNRSLKCGSESAHLGQNVLENALDISVKY